MRWKVIIRILKIDDDPGMALQAAAEALQAGGVVAIPTDTVYGLAAVASQPEAVERLAEMKGRSKSQPIAVLVADADQAESLVGELSAAAATLMDAFWPGPLTIVLPVMDGKAALADVLLGRDKQNDADEPARTIIGASSYSLESQSRTRPAEAAGKATIGVRCPDHAWVRELASQVGPIAATSANQHGKPPSITAEEVVQAFSKTDASAVENASENTKGKSPQGSVPERNLALVIDGGPSTTVASTVIDCLSPHLKILREGPITQEQIDAALSL